MESTRRRTWARCIRVALTLSAAQSGCSRDARLAGKKVREVKVGTVTDQGLTLGPLPANADDAAVEEAVKQVVFVLLRAIRDDVEAGGDQAARDAALDRQFAVAAPQRIYALQARVTPRMVDTRDEAVHKTVITWAPTLAHYVDQLDDDWLTANQRMHVIASRTEAKGEAPDRAVLLPLVDPHDPTAPPRTARIELTHENGYWRVCAVAFSPRPVPTVTKAAATQPAPPQG